MAITIEQLVADIQRELDDSVAAENRARGEIEAVLKSAAAEKRRGLTVEEDEFCEIRMSRIEQEKTAQKSIRAKLARAKAVEEEERQAETRLDTLVETPAARKMRGEATEYTMSVVPRVSARDNGHGQMTYDVEYETTRSDDNLAEEWQRASDGRVATLARGQRFVDHEVMREVAARTAQRDRQIIEAHGNFGQYLRAMTTSGASAIVPTVWAGNVIDLARNASVIYQAGARQVPMDAKVLQIGRLTQDPAPLFKAEGDAVTPGDLTYDYVSLSAKSLSALVVTSLEFLQDAPNASELISSALGTVMGLTIDKVALFGQLGATGTNDEGSAYAFAAPNNPKGLLKALVDYNSGSQIVGSFPTNGTAQTAATPWNEMLAVVYKVLRSNEQAGAIVSNVALKQQYDGMYNTLYDPITMPPVIASRPWLQTNAIPSYTRGTMTSRATDVFCGDWSQLLIGQRLGLEIRVLTERYAENGQVGLLAYWRGDVAVARPTAFACYRGLQGAV